MPSARLSGLPVVIYISVRDDIMKYSVHLIDESGKGSYLSVKGRTSWGKRTAMKHAHDIASTKAPVFGAAIIEVEDDFGFVVKTYTREVAP